ncbi:MAG: F0F1 ATP synthase subunit epsilon [Candidatus Aminicenantes bacterium]|nr:MAG: F0F1 ATP synthase subunit epsilon [Candidatus Aminicenantes bacterium]
MSKDLPATLKLKVISPTDLLVDEEVLEVSLPSLEGYLGIFPGHRPLFVALGRGLLAYKRSDKHSELSIQGGYAEVLPDHVLVFTERAKDEKSQPTEGQG